MKYGVEKSTTFARSSVIVTCDNEMSYVSCGICPATIASKFSLRNSIFSPHLVAMSVTMSNSTPLLILLGSTSPPEVPQKFGPGRLVTTLSTPGLTGLQSVVAPPPDPEPGVVLAALVDAAVVGATVSDVFVSLPHAPSCRPTAVNPTNNLLDLICLP